jgi:uncharacterized protein YqjF (DUF2071 family)
MDHAAALADQALAEADLPDQRIEMARRSADRHCAASAEAARYVTAELAFLEWEVRRGSLAPLHGETRGSAWWRGVNGQLLRDCYEAHLLADAGAPVGSGSNPAVNRWLEFAASPSPRTWYRAHNRSILEGYVRYAEHAPSELNAEQDFMGAVLLRVLAAEAAVNDVPIDLGPITLGAFGGLADPRGGGVGEVCAIEDFYPRHYPLTLDDIDRLAHRGQTVGRILTALVDDLVRDHTADLVAWAADAHDLDELRSLLDGNHLVYPQGLQRGPSAGALAALRTTGFDDHELEAMRSSVDPDADHVVGLWFRRNDAAHPASMLVAAVRDDGGEHHESARDVASAFIGDRTPLPAWVDHAALDRAADFFATWGVEALLMLGCSSLPDAYASHKGVQVLHLTARLETDTRRRLIETLQMVLDVTRQGGLYVGGQGRTTVRKVRLMHAGIRYLIEHDPRIVHTTAPAPDQPHWDPGWGRPINQEDMLGTLTTFTWNVVEGLRRCGVPVSERDADDWVKLWNVVGHLLGIPDAHLPADYATTCVIAHQIRARQHGPSEAGRTLTASLMEALDEMTPGRLFDRFPEMLAHHVLDPEVARLVGIGPQGWTRVLFRPAHMTFGLSKLWLRLPLMRRVVRRAGHQMLGAAMQIERGPLRPSFAIPSHLDQRWDRGRPRTLRRGDDGLRPQRARGPWVASMGWDNVVAGHWRVDRDVLRRLVPEPLELDEFDGSVWVSVLALRMSRVHFRFLPPLPGAGSFAELNVRTYVRHGGRRGVWFLSIDTHPGAVVWLSRAVFGQPYHRADLTYDAGPLGGKLDLTRRAPGDQGDGARLRFDFEVTDGQGDAPESGSLSEFLAERYWMFRTTRRGKVRASAVAHEPWPLKPATWHIHEADLSDLAGIELRGGPEVTDWAGSVWSKVYLPQP